MKKILSIKYLIILLIALVILAGGFYAFKKMEVRKVQVIMNENQATPKAETATEEVAQNDAVSENGANKTETGQNTFEVVEKAPSISVEKSAEPIAPATQKIDSEIVSKKSVETIVKLFTSGFQVAENRKIDTIIIHSSYDALGDNPYSISGIIQEYKDYGVSAHYLIGRDGVVYQLVREKDIAYHAGVSSVPDGRTGVNAFSVGIELVNTKTNEFTTVQYSTLKNLISELKSRYSIKYVLGHNQIAPERKDDPWNFDWSKLK
jgi:uncharacterized protein YxeA